MFIVLPTNNVIFEILPVTKLNEYFFIFSFIYSNQNV